MFQLFLNGAMQDVLSSCTALPAKVVGGGGGIEGVGGGNGAQGDVRERN